MGESAVAAKAQDINDGYLLVWRWNITTWIQNHVIRKTLLQNNSSYRFDLIPCPVLPDRWGMLQQWFYQKTTPKYKCVCHSEPLFDLFQSLSTIPLII